MLDNKWKENNQSFLMWSFRFSFVELRFTLLGFLSSLLSVIYNIFYNFLFSLLTSTPRFRCIFRSGVVIGKILIFMTITVSFGKQFESVRTMRSYLLFLWSYTHPPLLLMSVSLFPFSSFSYFPFSSLPIFSLMNYHIWCNNMWCYVRVNKVKDIDFWVSKILN